MQEYDSQDEAKDFPFPDRVDKEINSLCPESQDMFRRLVESVKSGVYVVDTRGKLMYVNHAFAEILGYETKDEILGKNLTNELYADPAEREIFLKKMAEKGFVLAYEVRNRRKDGSVVRLSATSHYIYNHQGEIIGVEGIVQDITETKRLEEALMSEKRKLEQILGFDEKIGSIRKFDTLIDFIVEKTTKILEVEKCSIMLLDEDTNELCIQGFKGLQEDLVKTTRLKLGDPIAGVVAIQRKPLLVKNIEYDEHFKRANRPNYQSRSFMIVPITMEQKLIGVINVADKIPSSNREEIFTEIDLKILCALAREVAVAIENLKLYKELNYLTVTDSLTQIFNYRQFARSLEYEIQRSKRTKDPLSLIMMDIDDFKLYNDTFGHLEGDTLLKDVSTILKTQLRSTDVICRYAGDEFTVILPDTTVDGGRNSANKIKEAIEQYPFKRKVTVSIGIAGYALGLTSHELVNKADKALYQAKKEGKNKISVNA